MHLTEPPIRRIKGEDPYRTVSAPCRTVSAPCRTVSVPYRTVSADLLRAHAHHKDRQRTIP